MSQNLLETVWGYFDDALVDKAAGYLGESAPNIRKSLESIIPVTLGSMVHKAETGNVESLLNLSRDAHKSGILSSLTDNFVKGGGGVPDGAPALLNGLFGDKLGAIQNAITGHTGAKGVTASSLFGSIVPLALGLLGKHAADSKETPGGLSSWLLGQKSSILAATPSFLSVDKFFGTPSKPKAVYTEPVVEKKKNNWLLPLLLALLAAALLWWWQNGRNKETDVVPVVADTLVTAKTDTVIVDKSPTKITLPNGTVIDAYKGGIEDLLIAFILDSNATSGKDNWFDFNNLNFKFGTAEIVPESEKEISNIVEILKAFPKVKIKIGGYTDKVGDEKANVKLSGSRAATVASALKAAGVGGQVTGSEGYGSAFAKYPADAPEVDRIKDRRVSVSVREK